MPESIAAAAAYVGEAFAGEAAVTGAADVAASAGVAGGTAASGGGALAASGSYAAGTEALFGAGGAAGGETLGGSFLKSAAQAGGAGVVSSLLTPRPQKPNVAPIWPSPATWRIVPAGPANARGSAPGPDGGLGISRR